MKRTWTHDQVDLLKIEYPMATPKVLRELFSDKTTAAIKSKAKALGLKKAAQRFHFTPDQIQELAKLYPDTLTADLAEKFGCSIFSVRNAVSRLGLKKNIEFIRSTAAERMKDPNHPGRKYQFSKGAVSANKGRKQSEYMSWEAIERTKATRFKKGQKAWNHKPLGYERVSVDGYIEVKIGEPKTFKLKHRVIWEQHHGKIKKGENVQFKDGNRQNCDINNLYLISREEQMKQNSGSINLTDGIVAAYIAGGRGKNKSLIPLIRKHQPLIELKRQQLLLNRKIKDHGKRNADESKIRSMIDTLQIELKN